MRRFAALYRALDESTAALDKRAALQAYLREAPPEDAAWALWCLCGGRLARVASGAELRAWVGAAGGHPDWLVEASYAHVGDLAETVTLLHPEPDAAAIAAAGLADRPLHAWIERHLQPLARADAATREATLRAAWAGLPEDQRYLLNKLLTGALRVGVSTRAVQQAIAAMTGIDIARIAQRMLGDWAPTPAFLARLLSPEDHPEDARQPYPFFLAAPLEGAPHALGDIADWQLEWKWDGIRLQLLRREGGVALWSRGEERLDGRFPELEDAARALPEGCVLDGELVAWDAGTDAPAPFTRLQQRIGRRRPGAKTLAETPVRMLAYDLLEHAGVDLRARPLRERRARLEALLAAHADPRIAMPPALRAADWDAAAALRADARARGVEGLMLKRADSAYGEGRRRGAWWKWKLDPLTIDAVLLYAQAGHGRRSGLHTDWTFGVWRDGALVPVAKAYSGLDDAGMKALDAWIRAHTIERFGPVRQVQPLQVFELGFEGVNRSARHRSGVAVRFPRVLRWRQDKPAAEADTLEALWALAR